MSSPASIPLSARLDADALRDSVRLEDVIAALFARPLYATPRSFELRCRCLSHSPDKHPSLRIHTSKRVAYCDVCHWHGDVFTVIRLARNCSFSQAVTRLATMQSSLRRAVITPYDSAVVARSPAARSGARGPWAVYPYCDERGTLLYEKIRTPYKSFWYRKPDGETELGDVRRVLYGLSVLHQVIGAGWPEPWSLVVEGEKDVETAWRQGLPAVTNCEGAGLGEQSKWRPEYSIQLRDAGVRRVYVIPDDDAAGRNHSRQILASCWNAGLSSRLVRLPYGKDLSDFVEAGGTRRDVLRLLRRARAVRS